MEYRYRGYFMWYLEYDGVNIRGTWVCISGVRGYKYPGYEGIKYSGHEGIKYPGYVGMYIRGTRVSNIRGTRL